MSSTYRKPAPKIAAATRTVSMITRTLPAADVLHDRYPPPEGEEPFTYIPTPRPRSWRDEHAVDTIPPPPDLSRIYPERGALIDAAREYDTKVMLFSTAEQREAWRLLATQIRLEADALRETGFPWIGTGESA